LFNYTQHPLFWTFCTAKAQTFGGARAMACSPVTKVGG